MYISGFFPQVMQMYSLNRRIHQSNVTVNCLHPGVVDSEFTRSFRDDCHWTCLYRCAKCTGIYNIHFVNRMYFPYTQHKKSSSQITFPPKSVNQCTCNTTNMLNQLYLEIIYRNSDILIKSKHHINQSFGG